MKSLAQRLFVIAAFSGLSAVPAQAATAAPIITGVWQGTMEVPGQPLRRVLKISRGAAGSLRAVIYSLDESDAPIQVKTVTLRGHELSMTIDMNTSDWPDFRRSYRGAVSADGTTIAGSWQSVSRPFTLNFQKVPPATAWAIPRAPRKQFVTVQKAVRLETLDWGGTGRPLVLLAGLGNTGHVFFQLVPKLTPNYHVYSITRRGFGASSKPDTSIEANYSADRLGDDVLAVVRALKLNKPVIAGHSIAGEELSSIGSRYPGSVSGLIYLDAGYAYGFYDRTRGDIIIDANDARRKLSAVGISNSTEAELRLIGGLQASLTRVQTDLPQYQKSMEAFSSPDAPPLPPFDPVGAAIIHGEQVYTNIPVPVLAIFAVPHRLGAMASNDPQALAKMQAEDLKESSANADAFERGVPGSHVVRIANADHYVFTSNTEQVVREMETFIDGLPKP